VSDTQWPLYEVFHQERPDKPHLGIGAVHAPDPEMALQNGRDIFVRRPSCFSLWVAPASAIFTKTAEEMALDPSWQDERLDADAPTETYVVFQKQSQRRAMGFVVHVGQVEAQSPVAAMKKAVAQFSDGTPFVWWVCPKRAITHSQEEDVESMFDPAKDKIYRMPNQYRTVSAMKEVRRGEGDRNAAGGAG
jgi:ring-1,2-phenylacetyl-CoA epoxidase subunit PaaB